MNIFKYKEHNRLIPFYLWGQRYQKDLKILLFQQSYCIVTCSEIDGTFIIEAIAVRKQYERQYIGTQLLNFTVSKLKKMNAADIILNAKNTILFEKMSTLFYNDISEVYL